MRARDVLQPVVRAFAVFPGMVAKAAAVPGAVPEVMLLSLQFDVTWENVSIPAVVTWLT